MRWLIPFVVILLSASLATDGRIADAKRMSNAEFSASFNDKFKEAGTSGVPAYLELGKTCFNAGFGKLSDSCMNEVLALEPYNKEANLYLCRVKVGKDWMSLKERDDALISANPGKVMFGARFVTQEAAQELLKAARAKVGWEFDTCLDSSEMFTLYASGDAEVAWSTARLVEATLMLFELEFGDALKRPKNKLVVHVFSDQKLMDEQILKVTGQAVSSPCIFDPRSMASYALCGPTGGDFGRDIVVEATIRGILGLHGHNANYSGHWLHSAFLFYFRMGRVSDEKLSIGHYRQYNPDLFTIAQRVAAAGALPTLESLTSHGPEVFNNDPNSELRAESWALFYMLQHEYQGLYKKDFHEYIKGAVKGKADYRSLKKLKDFATIEKTYGSFISQMKPIGE